MRGRECTCICDKREVCIYIILQRNAKETDLPLDPTGAIMEKDSLREVSDIGLASEESPKPFKQERCHTAEASQSSKLRTMQRSQSHSPRVMEMVQALSQKTVEADESPYSKKRQIPVSPIMEVGRSPSPSIMEMVERFSPRTSEVGRSSPPKPLRAHAKAEMLSKKSPVASPHGSQVTFASQKTASNTKGACETSTVIFQNTSPPCEPGPAAQKSEPPSAVKVKPQVTDMKREGAVQAFEPKHVSVKTKSWVKSPDMCLVGAETAALTNRPRSSDNNRGKASAPNTSLPVPIKRFKSETGQILLAEASAPADLFQSQQQHQGNKGHHRVWAKEDGGNVNEATQTSFHKEEGEPDSSTFESSCPSTSSALLLVVAKDQTTLLSDVEHASSVSGPRGVRYLSEACSDGLSLSLIHI